VKRPIPLEVECQRWQIPVKAIVYALHRRVAREVVRNVATIIKRITKIIQMHVSRTGSHIQSARRHQVPMCIPPFYR